MGLMYQEFDSGIATLIAACLAAITSIVVVVLSIRTQKQIEKQKISIEKEIQSFNDNLERKRLFAGFKRERVTYHLDEVINSCIEIAAITKLVINRSWIHLNQDHEAESLFLHSISRIRVHFDSLAELIVIPDNISYEFDPEGVHSKWIELMGLAVLRRDFYKKSVPDDSVFSEKKYRKCWDELKPRVHKLENAVSSISGNMDLLEKH